MFTFLYFIIIKICLHFCFVLVFILSCFCFGLYVMCLDFNLSFLFIIFFHNFCACELTIFYITWPWVWITNLNITRCDDGHQFGWSKCVVSRIWVMSNLVLACNANGYGKFDDCLTLKYILICHYSRRWLLAWICTFWAKGLCIFATNNNNYVGCDYGTCPFICAKGVTF